MAAPNEKLATSLTILRDLQFGSRRVFQSQELSRIHRQRLLQNGFLLEVMKGWLISSSPDCQCRLKIPQFSPIENSLLAPVQKSPGARRL
jgi:hypothetical protein